MKKNVLHEVMSLAWQMVKRNGYTMSEALKVSWLNIKLKIAMKQRIVRFYYRKVSGETREAFGSLQEKLLPPTQGTGKKTNDTLLTYFDTERKHFLKDKCLPIGIYIMRARMKQ